MKLTPAPPTCPKCSGREYVRNGNGRLLCKACGRTYQKRTPFPRARFPARTIIEAIVLSGANFSDQAILKHLKAEHSARISRQTLSSWKKKHAPIWTDYIGAFKSRELSIGEICRFVGTDFSD